MTKSVEVQYRDLLNPIKDPEKSFNVNISELLNSYINNFVQGKVPPNFNSAALLLQGSSSIYGKKVEYLHNLATQLYQSLLKNKKDELVKKDAKEKERHHREKEQKFNDPFCSIEIKPGKNLSCLRKKKTVSNKKTSKKSENSKKYTFVPVALLPLEGEEKGDIFYDLRGDSVGNKGDYALNKCRVTEAGWLLLPTISTDAVPSADSPPDYSVEFMEDSFMETDDMPESTPIDEGYPPSSGCSSTPGGSQVPLSQGTDDEGIGSLTCTPVESRTDLADEQPMDVVPDSDLPPEETENVLPPEGIENIPMEGIENDGNLAPRPVRRSERQVLKQRQLEQESTEDRGSQNQQGENAIAVQRKEDNAPAVKKLIQKKNTCLLPGRLQSLGSDVMKPASSYCARTFFSLGNDKLKDILLKCGVSALGINSKIIKRLKEHCEYMKTRNRKNSDDPFKENNSGLDNEAEALRSADPAQALLDPLNDEEIIIDNDPDSITDPIITLPPDPAFEPDTDDMPDLPATSEDVPELNEDMLIESFNAHSHHVITNALKGVEKNSDISRKVHEWEQTIKPFLNELSEREAFDINLYGSRILNSFDDSNRKQTISFKDFCKCKEKWEIHRYFMALLPLINVGNVSIETETDQVGEEEIFITLLSRKMHHKDLEEFGHTDGEHS